MRWLKHKHMRSLARRFWGTVILLVLVVAVIVQLGREAFPMLNDYKDAIARHAGQRLGVQVEIGAIEATWVGLRPRLEFHHVIMRTADGQQILTVGDAEAELSLVHSLREWQFVWRQLKFDQLRMEFQQEPDGRWTLGGVDLAKPRGDETAIHDPLDIFLLTRHLTVDESHFQFVFHTGHQAELSVPQLMLENEADFRRLTANFAVDGDQEAFFVVIEGYGNPRSEEEFEVQGHVALDSFPMEKAVAALDIAAWDAASEDSWSEGHRLDTRLWFSGQPYRQMTLKGRLRADGLPLALPNQVQMPAAVSALLTGDWSVDAGWRVALQQAEVAWNAFASPPTNVVLSGGFEQPLRLKVDRLELSAWRDLVQQAGLVQGRLQDVLTSLAPQGVVTNLVVERPGAGDGVRLKANLEQVSLQAFRGAPAVEGLDGYVEASRDGGRVVINSHDHFSMFYPQVYEQPQVYDTATGELRWTVQHDLQQINVTSSLMNLVGEHGDARGYVQLQLPIGGAQREPQMTLLVGLQDSQAKFHTAYVPRRIPAALRDWLQTGIRGGRLTEAGFLWHGSVAAKPEVKPNIQLFGEVEEGQLQFSPEWPALRQVSGRLTLDQHGVDIALRQATLSGNRIRDAYITLRPMAGEDPGQILRIAGEVNADLDDALQLIRNSPLENHLGPRVSNWQGSGPVRADVALTVPLGANAKVKAHQDVRVSFSNSRLALPKLRLMLDQVEGNLRYSTDSGVSSDGIKFGLWGHEGRVSFASDQADGQLRELQIEASGRAPVESLADWLGRPEMRSYARGAADFALELQVPLANGQSAPDAQLVMTSDLAGLAIDLPAPYGKPEAEMRNLRVTAQLGQTQHYRIAYEDLMRAQFVLEDQLQSLSLALSNAFQPLEAGYLDVVGSLGHVDIAAWRNHWLAQTDATPGNLVSESQPTLVPRFDLQVENLQLEQLVLEQLDLEGGYENGRWRVDVESPHLTGELFWFADGRPLQVSLQSLHLPGRQTREPEAANTVEPTQDGATQAAVSAVADGANRLAEWAGLSLPEGESQAGASEAEDSLAEASDPVSLLKNIALNRLPPVDVSIASLTSAKADYGAWEFQLRPVDGGIMLRNLRGRVMGLDFSGPEAGGTGGELVWLQSGGYNSTYLRGVVTSANLSDLLHQIGQAELLESESARFELELLWPGAPDEPKLQTINGTVAVDIRRGRFIRGAEAGNNPFLRLFALLNFDTLVRRLRLDFSDLYKEGMVFDAVTGEMRFADGQLIVEEALRVESPSSTLQFAGVLDAESEEIDATLVATLPVTGNLAVAAAFVGGLPAALGVYAVGKLFKEQVDRVSSIRYRISGNWDDPQIRVNRIFESSTDREARAVVPVGEDTGKEEDRVLPQEFNRRPLTGEPRPEARVPPRAH